MKIEKDKVVSLSYTLTVDGDVMETVTTEKPMDFIFGTGYLLPKFEENVVGKEVGDAFEFTLTATEGYGEINSDAIIELPKDMFMVEGKIEDGLLKVGNVLPMQDSDGNRLQGTVEEVREDVVIMNFNHPLAGSDLNFKGVVVAVREATQQEITGGLYGEKLQSSCSSGSCSGCSGC
ncbi:MAG: FKBP-type peptidyl-prolyl cis-trans isomerase [Bacteroidales bacterium]|jgi:FKBP-type peptidyl-prolyl cis-trans isomerase SlyD|nr:FKBP-type peptidyl-prolyl cis-trans isomerase [Bacteroidales bacterium]MDD3272760.1 FKBP-type peptidyl-prolyl cis-trans isomerase [Bacteroidales bacterium]MDD4057475.1 FKBP-type peptidyl-prolyl cis-trans isomerase [Bacteroidales bacterium]